ncbi:uncharacterized protein BX663DRAFT_428667 [Cokeromyces recurvatus]|uniref:uncharacterized protein n=1 Tax=Cokeromyces recurvatus TaxID=90255 RepID=UPI00221F1A2E|nr:uncharacterized protein BX663DRAFT_428667 [Cokeromyces recurvatus]KAI7905884.1 hypothetical protein BX663DRAFT_428667 [Cokeromyces recurvatus]
MSDSEEAHKSFMSMLNNPIINPGPPQLPKSTSEGEPRIKPCPFVEVEEAKELLTKASEDVYLHTESDEGFRWIDAPTTDNLLPSSVNELVEYGLLNVKEAESNVLKTLSLQEFFDTYGHNNDDYNNIIQGFKKIQEEQGRKSEDSKVFLIGERAITVLILCIVQDKPGAKAAIIGLKSLLVQT